MKKAIFLAVASAAVALLFAMPALAQTPPDAGPPEEQPKAEPAKPEPAKPEVKIDMMNLAWEGVDLELIVKQVAKETGKRFMYDSQKLNLKNRKVYLITKDIPRSSLFDVFQSVLEMQNLGIMMVTIQDSVEIYKLYESQTLVVEPLPLFPFDAGQDNLPNNESVVSTIVQLKYISANNVKQLLLTLVTHPRAVTPLEESNALIITDYALNVKRILKVIEMVDKKKPDLVFKVIPLLNAGPQDIADKVRPISQALMRQKPATAGPAGAAESVMEIVPDLRTKSIIVVAVEDRVAQIEELIKSLDVPVKDEPRTLHVYKLKHAKAKDLAGILNQIYSGPGAPTSARPAGAPAVPNPAAGRLSQEVVPNIIADEQNNTLLIVADDKAYTELGEVIEKLDKRKYQVAIKVHIVEITGDDTMTFGTELLSIGAPGEKVRGFGGTFWGMSSMADIDGDGIPDARVPSFNGLTWGLYKESWDKIPLLMQAMKSDSSLNVMSIPEVITNDNSEASLEAAEEEPVKSTSAPASVNSAYVTDIRYEKAGITLKITPHISQNNYLQLDISQQIESFGGNRTADMPPPKVSRNIKATVTLPNNQTVVLGGLTRDTTRVSESGIPFLKDIPFFSPLFKSETNQKVKTTLYVFITPRILVDENFDDYLKYSKDQQENVYQQTGGKWIGTRQDQMPTSLDIFRFKSPLED